jgi:hypothetical protein
LVDTELVQQNDEVRIRTLEQLQEPVLDFDVVVRSRHTETDRAFQRVAGEAVESIDQLFQIKVRHRSLSPFVNAGGVILVTSRHSMALR